MSQISILNLKFKYKMNFNLVHNQNDGGQLSRGNLAFYGPTSAESYEENGQE